MSEEKEVEKKIEKILTKVKKHANNAFPWFLRLFVAFLLVFQAFYPKTVEHLFWILLVILIVLIVAVVLVNVFTGGVAAFLAGNILNSIIVAVVVVFLIVLLMRMYPSPNYSEWIATNWGMLAANLSFLLVLAAVAVLLPRGPVGFLFGAIGFWIVLNVVGPFILHLLSPGSGFCIPPSAFQNKWLGQLDFLRKLECKERLKKETVIYQGKMVHVPVGGGIFVSFGIQGKPRPLPAGREYEEIFMIQNFYEGNITITKFEPWMFTYYMNGLSFIPTSQIKLRKSELSPREKLPGVITFREDELNIKARMPCKFTEEIIREKAKYTGIDPNKIPCAFPNYCNDSFCDCDHSICVETHNYVCNCTNWVDATCSGKPFYLAANVTHTGFFIGNASLYYSEEKETPVSFPQLKQGPITVTLNFWPNPYIRKYYEEYIDTVQLFGDVKIERGHDFTIQDVSVEPILTTVSTIDYEHNLQFNETIGISIKSCEGLEELKDVINNGATRWSGVLCNFTKPEVNLTVTNLKSGETLEMINITFDQIPKYCSGELNGTENITEALNGSGLCSVLNNTAVQHALEYTQVVFRMNYTITETFYSRKIMPYWTPECE